MEVTQDGTRESHFVVLLEVPSLDKTTVFLSDASYQIGGVSRQVIAETFAYCQQRTRTFPAADGVQKCFQGIHQPVNRVGIRSVNDLPRHVNEVVKGLRTVLRKDDTATAGHLANGKSCQWVRSG